jgi:hypothetical protein
MQIMKVNLFWATFYLRYLIDWKCVGNVKSITRTNPQNTDKIEDLSYPADGLIHNIKDNIRPKQNDRIWVKMCWPCHKYYQKYQVLILMWLPNCLNNYQQKMPLYYNHNFKHFFTIQSDLTLKYETYIY